MDTEIKKEISSLKKNLKRLIKILDKRDPKSVDEANEYTSLSDIFENMIDNLNDLE